MNIIDQEFYSFLAKMDQMTEEEIFYNMKDRFLKLDSTLQNNFETFLNTFLFWGKLEREKQNYEQIEKKAQFLKKHGKDFLFLYQTLKDYRSKKILLAILRNYYYYDFKMLSEVKETCYDHYFDLDLVSSSKDTIFVDVGAYTGDSIASFQANFPNQYQKIYGYEVTDASLALLKDQYCLTNSILIQNKAVFDRKALVDVKINAVSDSSNRIVEDGGVVEAVSLDEDIQEPIGIIKMDIEGGEEKALLGAKKHLATEQPTLLISVYHGFMDLIRLPELILNINPQYDLYLRYYGNEVFPTEIVLIAIPKKKE